ncbi:homoserine O-acetyltransferase MetX [Gordonia neofelifaecis]|uniref:Homoserine O-acetyltransferase n=1 Tax=Gordonia neofelifaecis NRRL B-59395 TaxID=644548 RepID=F1YFW2_9ACTN|nr:homoserine O-acetyltransferase [Gordonia neofelifaecis]EGD56539.1 homoserine O-acetyltransferase [Gordonia neofelifaecis NRRL B-59395]
MSVSIDPATTVSDPEWAQRPDGSQISVSIGDLALDSGAELADVTVTFQKWGTPNAAKDNIVLALHALTGNSHVTGPADDRFSMTGWWDGLIGPGCAVDTDEWCVLAPNSIGGCYGSTGPGSVAPDGEPWGSRFPRLTVRDLTRSEEIAFRSLGITRFAAVAGGSMGGARALEWAVTYPDSVGAALVLAVGARASADQIGTQTTQIEAIKADPAWRGGDYYGSGSSPSTGMGIARRIAHLSYRNDRELDERFENSAQGEEDPLVDGRYSVASYLEHQAEKLKRRFDPGSYVVLSDVLNNHDVGRGRGGVTAALNACPVPTIVGGIDSDRLYPLYQQEELARELGNCVGGLHVIHSDAGHDGFLTEFEPIRRLLVETMELARKQR